MLHCASHRSRRVVARVDGGQPLHEAVAWLARWEKADAALVRGAGTVEAASFAPAPGAAEAPRPAEGVLELVSLEGSVTTVAGAAHVVLRAVVAGPGGAALAGRLAAARAIAVELVLDVLDDVHLDREPGEGAAGEGPTSPGPWRPSPRR